MDIINIKGIDPPEDLRRLAGDLHGELKEELGFSSLKLNHILVKGTIATYNISDRLSAFKFDLRLKKPIKLQFGPVNHRVIDFIYCLEGSTKHSFLKNKGVQDVGFRQNTIISRRKGKKTFLQLPVDTNLKISFLIFDLSNQGETSIKDLSVLRARTTNLHEILGVGDINRHFGRVCFRTAEYVKVMMEKSVKNISDVFFVEAAILNILASQLGRYQADTQGSHTNAPIRPSEIDKIYAIHAFILDNLTENLPIDRLASLSGLSAVKLQTGFKYLYNNNVASYITQKRVELSARLMEDRDMNISEVVYAIGFSSRSYFSKIFKNRYGMRPSDYIKREVNTNVA